MTFQAIRHDKNHANHDNIQLRLFLFCSSTLCRRRPYTCTWDHVHLLNLSHHCPQKVLCFMLTGSKNLYFDTAAEYINSYISQGRVFERTVPVLLEISWFVGALLWARLPKFNYQPPYVRDNSRKVGSTLNLKWNRRLELWLPILK